ncbi:MAG: HEAT repeat domain-containing protein [Acidobacteria bacterium]|nr:HEAT repeat domain-containing protein [Acidobacteriota bacterium]
MAQASQLSPELSRGLLQLARALLVAARNWTMYPPEHPAVQATVERLCEAVRQSSLGSAFGIGITPDTLLIDGLAPAQTDLAIAEAAAMLHDRDLVHITFLGDISYDGIARLLRLLAVDTEERRSLGGPAKIWATEGHPSLVVEQLDYDKIFARRDVAEPAKRDDLWPSIVMAIAGGQHAVFDEREQQRLLAIAGNAGDIADLATAVMAPKCAADGSPMIASQAATVLAAFRHLTTIVSVMSPDRLPEVMGNLAAAATQLDPHVVMQLMQSPDEVDAGVAVVRGMTAAFDDVKVAQLLATALALEGRASDRLATIFNTIAPDEDRKRRVLAMTRTLLSETDFGKSGQFQVLWTSAEELLIAYNDAPYVSDSYRAALDGVGGRAERLAAGDLPPELPAWMQSLGQENVRTLSVTLLIDLLTIERDADRAGEIAHDMAALAEDLLMSGAYDDARAVTGALVDRAASTAIGSGACRQALDRLGESTAMRETALLLGDIDVQTLETLSGMVTTIGPSSIEALKSVLASEQETVAFQRAAELTVRFGRAAVSRLASLVNDEHWFVQRHCARLLGRIAVPDGVPLLQSLLRKGDPRVARAAVSALSSIPDPSAARAIHTILRAATGEVRAAVIDALVADRDARVVPILARIVAESQALGPDHEVVLETLTALGTVGSDDAIPSLVAAIQVRSFWRRKKARAIKERGVNALARIGSAKAQAALAGAAKTGDRSPRKIVQARGKP